MLLCPKNGPDRQDKGGENAQEPRKPIVTMILIVTVKFELPSHVLTLTSRANRG